MNDKIAGVIRNRAKALNGYWESNDAIYNIPIKFFIHPILDLITKELPKEKEYIRDGIIGGNEQFRDGYNRCLKGTKHNLGVE